MKLATLNNGKRDGALVVVSRDLSRAVRVPQLAATLQAALDEWAELAPKPTAVYQQLNDGACADAFRLTRRPVSPAAARLPVGRRQRLCQPRGAGAQGPRRRDACKLLARSPDVSGGSDSFLPPRGTIPMGSEEWGIDFESEIAVITDDVPMGTSPQAAAGHIKLLMLVNDVSLRNLIPGAGQRLWLLPVQALQQFLAAGHHPGRAGDDWRDGKVHLPSKPTSTAPCSGPLTPGWT